MTQPDMRTTINDWFTIPHSPDNSPTPVEAPLEEEDNLKCFAEKKDNIGYNLRINHRSLESNSSH